MFKKNILSVAVVLMMILTMSACSKTTTTEDSYENNEETAGTEEAATEETAAPAEEPSGETEETADSTGGTFTVGFDQDFPPMGFVGEDGEFTGFDIDLAKEAAARMGKELVLQPIAWDSKDMELESGNIDCIWNGFTINGREDSYTWTEPYMANQQVFVVTADSGIASMDDLAGKVVSVQMDSSAEAALNDQPELVASFGQFIQAADYNSALMDLMAGAVDAVAMDDTVARYQIESRGDSLVVLDDVLAAEEYGVGFALGNEALRDEVQAVLEEMAADGTMAEISNTWFGKDITTVGK